VCAGEATTVAPYRHSHSLLQGLTRAKCAVCELVFAHPMPDPESWREYNSRYFDNAHGGTSTAPVPLAFFSAMGQLRGAHVEQFLSAKAIDVATVLEVGPGGGAFSGHWLARHPSTAYYAIESDATCHPALKDAGVRLLNGPDDPSLPAALDLVALSHVLEHVTTPVEFLGTVTRGLRPGGAVFIEVPCRDWEHKTQDEPHVLFFDKRPMAVLLDRLGFRDIQLTYHGLQLDELRSRGFVSRVVGAVRNRLLAAGVVGPFSGTEPGLEHVAVPLERAVVKPFQAHVQQSSPAWWLRALAIKM